MPIYTTSYGKRYNIPSDIAAQFEKDFPDAQIRYEASGEEYDIPLKKRDSFLRAYPNAKTVDRISTPPKQDTQPEYRGYSGYNGAGGLATQTPLNEPAHSGNRATDIELQQLNNLVVRNAVKTQPTYEDPLIARIHAKAQQNSTQSPFLSSDPQQNSSDSNAPITSFGEAFSQGSNALYQGVKNAVGESAGTFIGSQKDYAKAVDLLSELQASGYSFKDFNPEKADHDYLTAKYNQALDTWHKVKAQRKKERESMGAWDAFKHLLKDPTMPTIPGKESFFKKAQSQADDIQRLRAFKHIAEALHKTNGDIEQAKSLLGQQAQTQQWSDKVTEDARNELASMRPTEGTAAFIGNLVPQMIGNVAAVAASFSPFTRWLARPLAQFNMATLTASSAGSSMADARLYAEQTGKPISESDVKNAGLLSGGIEAVTELIPYARIFNRIQHVAGLKSGRIIVNAVKNNPVAQDELTRLVKQAGSEFPTKLITKKGAKRLAGDILTEGTSEAVAGGLGTLVPILYSNKEDYPTLHNILSDAWEGAKGGLFMGAILGAGSALSGNFANRERRKKLGKITLADTGNGVVEIVGAKSDGTLFAVDGNNKILEIPKSQILDIAEVGFKEFDAYTKKITDETLAAAVQSGKMVVQQNADPSAKQAIKQHLNQVSAPFSEERLQELHAVKNPMQYISEHPQEAPQLLEWFKANSTYTGMIEAVQDQIQQKIKESDDAVDSRTHTDGNLYTITLKGDNAAQGYITQGDVTFNPDGSVNKTKSNDRVTVRYADGHSEMLSIDDLGRLVETNNAQELKAQNADAIWEEESRRAAAEIDGTTGPSQGDPITLKDGRRGIFYADTGDGNYLVQLEDGSVIPAPQTAVTLLNRQPSQQQPTPQPAQTTPQQAAPQSASTSTAEQTMTPSPAQEPQNGVDNRIGRSLNKEEADNLIAEMENRAEPAPELELTPENWTAEFGEDGMVDTPIGKVKMGENQYQKLVRNKRENYFGMIKPTLESPDMVLEEADPKEGAERDTKLIFVKTFTKPDGSRVVHFENVTIQKDNLEVSISSHELQKSALQKKMQQDNLLHLKGLFSSEGRLAEPQIEGSDLVPTPSLSSTNEDTTPFAENQIPADQNNTDTSSEATQTPTEVTYPRDEKTGHILFDQIDDPTVVAAALRNEFGEQALEAAQTKLQDLQGELEKAASTKDTFERLYKQRDLQREIAKYQQVVSTLTPTEVEQITPQEMNRAEVQPENVQNETNRSEQQGQETTNTDTQTTNADQSEVDENGRPFVKASDGSTVFGEITEDTGLTPAPIKLSEGVITNTTTNDGYGLAHIEARHGDQIRQAGFDSVEEFVESVAKNYDQIKEGRKRNDGSETYLLQLEDKHNNTLFVELSKDGSYWNINSAGIFNNKYARGNKVVYSRHTQTNQFAETGEGSPSTEQSGTQSDASTLPPTSANEDTTNIQENQESASKNTENQTNPPTNKTNTPILPKKQTAPKYAKEIAQFGDEVSIEDVVLRDIALGQKFSWEDHGKSRGIASELGFTGKEAERRSRISMLRNDGITVDDYVHGLWQEYGERFRQDDAQIRDAVLDVLQRVYSPKAAMEQLRNLHAQEEFSQEEQNILTPEEREAFWNIPVSEYAFREPEANTPEEQQIIDQAKQNGTYMKAPNGQPSNLTEKQWVQVRTQAFKNWFGDWEKIAKLANSKHKGNERNRSKQAPEYTDDFRRVQARSRKLSQEDISAFHRDKQDLNENERELLSGVFRRQLLSARARGGYAQRTLIDPQQNIPVQILEDVDGQLFHDIFEIVRNYLKNGELVDLHENYDNATCYLAADGLSGFAVEDNGNLVSVFNLNPNVSFLKTIKDYVTKCGATHLDGYNSPKQPLAKIYQKTLGWKVASLMDYNMEFDHDDIAANHDAPQVAFMVNSSQDVETKSFNKDSYDEAEAYQQEQVKAIFENCSKVIDENGEPLAVYPVPSSTNTTDEGSGNDQQTGLYFETGGNEAGDRSRQAYFLNIRDPKYSSTQGDLSNTSHDGAILQSQQPGETSSATTYAVAKADQIQPATDLNEERSSENPDTRYRNIDEVNDQFNAELQQQIEGTLPKSHIYRLGHPSEALQAAGIPNLPIELAASRLSDKSMQANHPFELSEIENLPEAIQQPLAVFRSATHIGSYVVMTEIEHQGKNYVAAIQTHRQKGRLEINDIRSIHYRRTNTHMVNWIDEGLLEYVDKQKMVEWLSKQRYNSAEVRKLFNHATNIVNSFENPTLTDGKKVATAEELSETLHTPIRIVRNVNDIHDDEKEALRKRRAYGWYDMETGEVVIVLPNCRDEAEVQATILHEVVGHKGLRELVGEEKYNDLLRRVWSSLDPATKAKKQKQYGHPLIAADEYLASLAEENVEPNVLKRILAQVRNWLREVLGMDIKLSDNDLRYLLWRSKHNLQNKQNIFERAETAAKDAELRYRLGINNRAQAQTENSGSTELDAVNRRFNEQLETLTEKNAQSVILNLGRPNTVLQSAGIADRPIRLYGNKVMKKIRKHGFKITDIKNLPSAINNPIAVFNNYGNKENRAVFTELATSQGNVLVTIEWGKGTDAELNIVTSVFGKGNSNIIDWINSGYTTYINKEKALNYLRISALIAEAQDNQELSLATNIIKNFENPTLPSEENIRFREQDTPSDLPTSQVSSSQEKLREELKHLRTLRKGLDSEVMQYRKRGAQNESSSTRQLKDIIARYNRSQRQIREYVNDILDAQAATTLGKREINTLLSALVRATDPQKAEEAVHRILDTVTTARLRAETARTEKLYSTKIQGETPQGVPEAKGVDDNTRVMIEYFRAHKEENINELEEALRTKEATEGLTPAEQMHMDAIYLIRLYQQATEVGNDYMAASAQMEQLEQQIDTLSKEVWHLQRAKATGGEARRKRTIEQKQQTMVQKGHLLEATRWQLQELKQNYLEQLQGFNDILQEVILNGRSAYLDWVHKQQDRQREILQGAFADAGPKAMASARQYGGWKPQGPLHKSVLAMRDFFTAPLLSLDYLIRKHTQSAPNGEGHLYNQFIRGEGGYMEASNRYFERTREITDALGEAAQRYMGISGKNMGQRWLRAQAQARRSPLTFSLQLNDGSRPQVISATQALYLRALEKQTDGQVKLRAMGISEEVMEQISQTLQQEAPEMVALADWVQEQLLPSLRESYNATHLRLFGTQMREVAHYFPISINKREIYRENDGTEHEQTLPTTTTGSIISRKPNTTAIDWNMDFFEVLDRHIQQMEHWNAYSEVVQNMNRLTSNTLFKKSLEYKNPGEARKFMDAARVAAEQYRIQVLDHESVIVKLSQAAASSKINFRVWTAIKQIASSPAFVAYSADPQFWATLSKHVATLPATLLGRGDYSWAKANLPDFRRRVQGGTAGNDALERESFSVVRKLSKDPRSPLSYGMWANAHMDAVVCAMGAKAVYEYQLSRHKRRGLSESEAQRAARRDAELSYNLSQQSALGVNLSPMQRSRNFFSVIFSTFQNAQFLYGRQLGDALRELTRSTELETEALYQRYRTQGMESAQARRAALKDVSLAKRTSVVRILTYGWGLQLLWVAMSNALPYIFGGDDDDKNLWVESAKNPAVWIGPLQGLFGGGNLTSIAEGYPFGGPMLFEDISRFWRNYGEAAQSQGIFSWETAGVTLDLLTEFSLSQNSETFMNLYNGVQAFIDGHSTAGLLQLINAPRSQIKKILLQRGEHESLLQYAERINNLQELFRAIDRSAQGARGTSYPLYEELEQAN